MLVIPLLEMSESLYSDSLHSHLTVYKPTGLTQLTKKILLIKLPVRIPVADGIMTRIFLFITCHTETDFLPIPFPLFIITVCWY